MPQKNIAQGPTFPSSEKGTNCKKEKEQILLKILLYIHIITHTYI